MICRAALDTMPKVLGTVEAEMNTVAAIRAPKPPFPSGSKVAGLVVGCGAVGGLVSWIIQAGGGAKPFGWAWYAGIPSLLILGAVAAVIGVYLIANSDTTELRHTLSFAVVCGIFWQPVIQAGQTYVTQTVAQYDSSAVQTASEDLSKAVQNNSASDVRQRVTDTSNRTVELLQKIPTVGDPAVKSRLATDSKGAIMAIAKASKQNPTESIDALQKVGVVAAQNGEVDVAAEAVKSLKEIERQNPGAVQQTNAASAEILTAAQKPIRPLRDLAPRAIPPDAVAH
jgi:hypothetical protein